MSELRSCVVEVMIRGYHEYQSTWEAEIGENLTCILEPGNVHDPYAVAVTKSESSLARQPLLLGRRGWRARLIRVFNNRLNSWTCPKKNVSYNMFALSSKRRQ